jgi:two-component system, NtrC family, sensor kinase
MKRRSEAGGKPAKGRARKTATPKRRVAPKAVGHPGSAAAGQETEIARLTRERDEALAHQHATAEILSSISSSTTDAKPVFDAIVRNLLRLFGASTALVALLRDGMIHVGALDGEAGFERMAERYPLPLDDSSVPGRAMSSKHVIHLAPMIGNPETPVSSVRFARDFGFNSLISAPMLRGDKVIGAIIAARGSSKPFHPKQIELIRSFAAQGVIAIENTRLLNELHQRTDDLTESLEQQTATSEVLSVISSSPGSLEPVFQIVLANATRICGAKFATIFLREGEALRSAAMHGAMPAAWTEQWRSGTIFAPDTKLLAFQAIERRQPVQVVDLRATAAYLAGHPKAVHSADIGGIRTMVTVPMLKDDEVAGVIAIFHTEVRPFTDKQIELVQSFAAQAVIAIENTRLLSELRESLEQQTATAEVLGVINASRGDLQPVFEAMVEKARRLCEADAGHLALPVGDDYRSVAVAAMSLEMEVMIRSVSYAPGRGTAVGRALAECRPVQISDIGTDHEHVARRAADKGFIRTILGVPLLREGEAIGAFGLSRQRVEPFSERQIELVRTFADQAVIAIENTRLLNELQQRTDDLTASLENLRTAQDRLVQTEKLASLGQLTAGIAHEIKNPLNFVNNFSSVSVELIDELREALSGAQLDTKLRAEIGEIAEMLQGNLDKVVQHGKRADSIVKNMLLHSREGSGEHRPVDINALVEESLNLAYHGARAERPGFNIVLERSFDPAAGEADLFPQEITRVLLNLISNGFYATTKRQAQTDGNGYEPTLSAATKNLGSSVEISIRDNGTGIPPEVKEKMFNPFFTTKPAGEGTGLGLSISHDIIVKQHGGSIAVDTEPGQFTEFKIVLPRAGVSPVKP